MVAKTTTESNTVNEMFVDENPLRASKLADSRYQEIEHSASPEIDSGSESPVRSPQPDKFSVVHHAPELESGVSKKRRVDLEFKHQQNAESPPPAITESVSLANSAASPPQPIFVAKQDVGKSSNDSQSAIDTVSRDNPQVTVSEAQYTTEAETSRRHLTADDEDQQVIQWGDLQVILNHFAAKYLATTDEVTAVLQMTSVQADPTVQTLRALTGEGNIYEIPGVFAKEEDRQLIMGQNLEQLERKHGRDYINIRRKYLANKIV